MNISTNSWNNLHEDIFNSVAQKLKFFEVKDLSLVSRSWNVLTDQYFSLKSVVDIITFCSFFFNPRTNNYICPLMSMREWSLARNLLKKTGHFAKYTKLYISLVQESIKHGKDVKDLSLIDAINDQDLKKKVLLNLKPKLKPSFEGDIALTILEGNQKFYEYQRIYDSNDYYFYDFNRDYQEKGRYLEIKERIDVFRNNKYQEADKETPLRCQFTCDLVAQRRYEEALAFLNIPNKVCVVTQNTIFYFLENAPAEMHGKVIAKLLESPVPHFKCHVSLIAAYRCNLFDQFHAQVMAFKEFIHAKLPAYEGLAEEAISKNDIAFVNKLIRENIFEETMNKLIHYLFTENQVGLIEKLIDDGCKKAFDLIFHYFLNNKKVLVKLMSHPDFEVTREVIKSCCLKKRLDLIIDKGEMFTKSFTKYYLSEDHSDVPEPYHTIIEYIDRQNPKDILGPFLDWKYFDAQVALKEEDALFVNLRNYSDLLWENPEEFKKTRIDTKIPKIIDLWYLQTEEAIDVALLHFFAYRERCGYEFNFISSNKESQNIQKYIVKLLLMMSDFHLEALLSDIDKYILTLSDESLEEFKKFLLNNPLRVFAPKFERANKVIEKIDSRKNNCIIS